MSPYLNLQHLVFSSCSIVTRNISLARWVHTASWLATSLPLLFLFQRITDIVKHNGFNVTMHYYLLLLKSVMSIKTLRSPHWHQRRWFPWSGVLPGCKNNPPPKTIFVLFFSSHSPAIGPAQSISTGLYFPQRRQIPWSGVPPLMKNQPFQKTIFVLIFSSYSPAIDP